VRRLLTGLALTALLATTACAPSADDGDPFILPQVGPPKVDIDTPALRAQKKAAGVEPCVPGDGSSDLPQVTLPCLGGGRAVDLASLEGPLVVNLWATWCTACQYEMPFYAEFARKHGATVPVIGVDYSDVHPDAALQLVADSGATFPQFADLEGKLGAGALGHFNPDKFLPIVILVSADGSVWTDYREIKSLGELEDLVSEHLGVTL